MCFLKPPGQILGRSELLLGQIQLIHAVSQLLSANYGEPEMFHED